MTSHIWVTPPPSCCSTLHAVCYPKRALRRKYCGLSRHWCVHLRPCSYPTEWDPDIACWLYIPASLPPPPPTVFCTLIATLSPSDPRFATPLFETYSTAPGSRTGIPLGSHVCVHLNASLLPTPFLGQSEPLQYPPCRQGWDWGLSILSLFLLLANKNPCPPSR